MQNIYTLQNVSLFILFYRFVVFVDQMEAGRRASSDCVEQLAKRLFAFRVEIKADNIHSDEQDDVGRYLPKK